MFIGRFTHSIDAKGRLTVPQRLRKLSADGDATRQWERAVLTVPPQCDSIHLYLEEDWETILAAATQHAPVPDAEAQRFQRLAGAMAQPVECDQLGRIVVPNDLREMVGIEREALWIGATVRAEIWNPERWKEYLAKNQADYSSLWDIHAKRTACELKTFSETAPMVPETAGAE